MVIRAGECVISNRLKNHAKIHLFPGCLINFKGRIYLPMAEMLRLYFRRIAGYVRMKSEKIAISYSGNHWEGLPYRKSRDLAVEMMQVNITRVLS